MSHITQTKIDDKEMAGAIRLAKASFDEFLNEVNCSSEGYRIEDAMVKLYVFSPEAPNEGDHIWARYLGRDTEDEHRHRSEILSKPVCVRLDVGDVINFSINSLSDWLYVKGGVAHGAFTVQLLRSRMNDVERMSHDSNYPFKF